MSVIETITLAAQAAGLAPALLLSVCFQESSFRNVIVPNDNGSPSYGICQMKLQTARQFRKKTRSSELLNIKINANLAASYLSWQIDRYDGNIWCAVNAYNRGHTKKCHVKITTKYVRQVKRHMKKEPWKKIH